MYISALLYGNYGTVVKLFLFPFLYFVLLEIDMCWLDVYLLAYRWSPDGVYFARIGGDAISVYETPVIVH